MIEIIAAPLTRCRKEQHLSLMTSLDHLLMAETIAKLGVETLYTPFKNALALENAAIEIELGSLTTAKMDEKDKEREDLITGFSHLVENGLHHFDSAKRNAAEILKHIVEKYGNFRRKTNAEETVAIRSMTTELLSTDNLPHLTNLNDGVDWITRLQTVNEEFGALYEARNAENNGSHLITSLEARAITNPCYNAIVKRVNALAEVNGEANYISFINQLNGFINDLKNTMTTQEIHRKKQVLPPPPKVG